MASVDSTTDPALVAATEPSPPPDISAIITATKSERHSLTLDQRRALRKWVFDQPTRPSHRRCIEWFFQQYGQNISQSTVSHSLSSKYNRLDADATQHLAGSRLRFGNWPDVEKLVLLWYEQVQASGRNPTNEELGEKAKDIFVQLPRYKGENPPNFSPGWIHRFKKRYGLLLRRQRRHGDLTGNDMAEDVQYLAECVPRYIAVEPDTSPGAIREHILRVVGVEASLTTCALVRDEIIRRGQNDDPMRQHHPHHHQMPNPQPMMDQPMDPSQPLPEPLYADDDPETVLQNALQELQRDEQAAEEHAAAVRQQREHDERLQMHGGHPPPHPHHFEAAPDGVKAGDPGYEEAALHGLVPIAESATQAVGEEPVRCPWCVNKRMLSSIKDAVEHMSTHVQV